MLAAVQQALRLLSRAACARGIAARKSDLKLATCLLLLEVALADGRMTDPERHCMESALTGQFGLGVRAAKQLICAALATRTTSIEPYVLTARLAERLSTAQRVVLVQMLRDVAHSDGCVTKTERYLMGKVSCLLRVDAGSV